MPRNNHDPRIDAYIQALPAWQQAFCQQVRDIVHAADPAVRETVKRSVQPYFVLDGNICALLAAKDHVNIFIYDPVAADPAGLINQGQGNATARTVQLYEHDRLDADGLRQLLQAVIANNKAGGWRKLQRS
jgi:hypothetical protein